MAEAAVDTSRVDVLCVIRLDRRGRLLCRLWVLYLGVSLKPSTVVAKGASQNRCVLVHGLPNLIMSLTYSPSFSAAC